MPRLSWVEAYKLRLKRRRLLWRSFRSRHQLNTVIDRTQRISGADIILVAVQRNEAGRLPHFLRYYRALGISHFLFIDNGSDDGSAEFLAEQNDVSLWRTTHNYRDARFGLDWQMWLLMRYCHGHWTLTADVDELLVYDGLRTHDLRDLAAHLDHRGRGAFGALMLEPYPKTPLGQMEYVPDTDPLEILQWFDAGPYRAVRQAPMGNLWVQGGVRERVFFADETRKSPTLNKLPFVRWNRRYAYVNSTHSLLPRHLNAHYSGPYQNEPAGVLLHTKFLPEIVSKSEIEKERGQHFANPRDFDGYYDRLCDGPSLWSQASVPYKGAEQLVELGLMPRMDWAD